MKIMIDSNVLVSAVYNPRSKPACAVRDVCENHDLMLCDHIVAECYSDAADITI
jgi:predicted nucleic acid-binding protein